jgi:hypothetical protein
MCHFYSQRKHHSKFFSPCYAFCLGHFEFKTLLMLSSAFSEKPKNFFVPDHPIGRRCKVGISELNFGTRKILHSANLQVTIQAAGFLRVPPKCPFKKLLLDTGLWQYAKMSTSLKSPNGSKDAECKKGQLSHRPPIPYVPVIDLVTPKEEPQLYKVKLPDTSHLSIPIYSRGNNKEYLVHVVAVLRIIEQKGLLKKCRVLAKAVVRQSKALKNLQEAAESQDTVSMSVDIQARKVEIEQSVQMLQESPKAQDKAIAETYMHLHCEAGCPSVVGHFQRHLHNKKGRQH